MIFLGVLQSSLKGRSAGGQLNKTSIEYSPVSGLSAGNSPTRKITRNSEKLQRALNSSNKYDQRPMIDNTRTEVGPTGMLGGAAQQVLGTMNRLLQSTPLLYGWDPRKGLSYYSGDSDVKHEETTMSISQPWELLDIANEKSSQGVTSRHSEEHVFDPNMSLNLHYSNSPTTTSHQALTAEDETEALSYDGSFKRLMESMSRLSKS